MALTETFRYKIEINEDYSLGVRKADIVLKDGIEIARSYERQLFMPGSDVSAEPQEVQDIAAVVWKEEVVNAYKASVAIESLTEQLPNTAKEQVEEAATLHEDTPQAEKPLTGTMGALAALNRLHTENAEGLKRLADEPFIPVTQNPSR